MVSLVEQASCPFHVHGRNEAGTTRSVNVSLVFQHEPARRIYVSGYCPERTANRVFALDLIMAIHAWN